MQRESLCHKASDGKQLHVLVWRPELEPARAVVHIAHGMGEHAARYARLAAALCDAGYVVYAHDHRGHGQTADTPQALGRFGPDGWWRCVQDLRELNERIRSAHAGLPVVLLGHSMGSFLAQRYLVEYGQTLDGAVLSGSTALSGSRLLRAIARFERWRLGADVGSPVLDKLLFGNMNKRFQNARTPFDWLSRDEAEVDLYIEDPLCGFVVQIQSLLDMFRGVRFLNRKAQARIPKTLPLYIFSGDQDPVHNQQKGLRRLIRSYQKAGLRNLQHRVYADGRHEMFNETNRDEVTQDLLSWLATQVAKKPAGSV